MINFVLLAFACLTRSLTYVAPKQWLSPWDLFHLLPFYLGKI